MAFPMPRPKRHHVSPRAASAALALALTVGLAALRANAAGTADSPAVLREPLQLSDADLSALVQGTPVAKTLTSSVPREMITAGSVRVRGSAMTRFVEQFKTLEGFRTSQFILEIEKFGETPRLSDLDKLTLEPADLESLRTCRVSNCEVQLSANDIDRFTRMNWTSPNAARDAAALYRAILFDNLFKYRAAGVRSLLQYQDREPGMPLAAETQSLLEARPSLLDQAPALREHMRTFPAGADPQILDFFYWSKEAFGFKPVVGLNHVSVHSDPATGRVTILTTQIYASHYIEGSVGIHALLPDRSSNDGAAFYWAFVNRARVGRLGGFLGKLARPIVQRRARSGLMKSLVQTKQRLEGTQAIPHPR
jgi:hypothetical protein